MAPKERSRIDGASLIDPSMHSPKLVELLNIDLFRVLIDYIIDRVVDVVDYALGRPSTSTHGRPHSRHHSVHAEFSGFATTVIERAGVKLPVLLGTLVYLDRAKPHLQLSLEEWACERVFLGALICSNKYLNDSTLKNVHWSLCTGLFNKRDVGRIEREFLDVLDFELRITEEDIVTHYDAVMSLAYVRSQHSRRHHRSSRTIAAPRPIPSRQSSGSSSSSMETDEDSPTSSDSMSLPETPESVAIDMDSAYVRRPSKHSPENDSSESEGGSPIRLAPITMKEPSKPKQDPALSQSRNRLSSAFDLFRNIHVPHFHSTS